MSVEWAEALCVHNQSEIHQFLAELSISLVMNRSFVISSLSRSKTRTILISLIERGHLEGEGCLGFWDQVRFSGTENLELDLSTDFE